MEVTWKRPDALFMEVRQKKLQELSEYQQKPSSQKAKDIIMLLIAMKGGKKAAAADAVKDEEAMKNLVL